MSIIYSTVLVFSQDIISSARKERKNGEMFSGHAFYFFANAKKYAELGRDRAVAVRYIFECVCFIISRFLLSQ